MRQFPERTYPCTEAIRLLFEYGIEEDIYEAISLRTCVAKRNTIGAPGPDAMEKVLAVNEAYLNRIS